jgi:hypothetical protein
MEALPLPLGFYVLFGRDVPFPMVLKRWSARNYGQLQTPPCGQPTATTSRSNVSTSKFRSIFPFEVSGRLVNRNTCCGTA